MKDDEVNLAWSPVENRSLEAQFLKSIIDLTYFIDKISSQAKCFMNNEAPEQEKEIMLPVKLLKKNALLNDYFQQKVRKDLVLFSDKSWTLVICIMVGVNRAVNSLYDGKYHQIGDSDYECCSTFEFGLLGQHARKYKICKFYDYSPYIFEDIRNISGINSELYLESVGPQKLMSGLISGNVASLAELCSPGRVDLFCIIQLMVNFFIL